MPVLSRFYGIVVKMYLLGKEHNPPHIHVLYGEYNAVIDIQTLDVLEGDLPGRGVSLAQEWAKKHHPPPPHTPNPPHPPPPPPPD